MASYGIFGVHDWAARLPPALAVHGTVGLVFFFGRRMVGSRAAFWGALTLALSPGFLGVGRLLVLDGLLTLFVTLSLGAGYEAVRGERLQWAWWLVAAAACGLGVLTKGPIAAVLVLPPLLLHVWLTGGGCRIPWSAWLAGGALVGMINVPWYLAVCLRLPEFGMYFFWKHNVLRFFAPFDHIEPVWYYGPILLLGLMPASFLGIAWMRYLVSSDPTAARHRAPAQGYLLLAGGWCIFFFSLSGSKLPTYIMPAFPPWALAFGAFLVGTRWNASRWVHGTAILATALLAVAHYAVVPWYADFRSPMSRADVVAQYCADNPVVCYPRNCDSVAFYLGRDDFHNFRSKETPALVEFARARPRTVVLFTHRHSSEALGPVLEASGMRLAHLTPMSRSWVGFFREAYCYMGIIENPHPQLAKH
jgi:4-amino-4-deoxy-L-arabinose transferase-like glycosyltransferase